MISFYQLILKLNKKIKEFYSYFFIILLNTLSFTMLIDVYWFKKSFYIDTLDSCLFYLKTPLTGVKPFNVIPYICLSPIYSFLLSFIFFIFLKLLSSDFPKINFKKLFKTLSFILLIFSFTFSFYKLGMRKIIFDYNNFSIIYERNYINPKKTKIILPFKKRNLIILFLESLEITPASNNLNGGKNLNYIPYLSKLAFKNNVNFSINNKLNGAFMTSGTTYTTAGIVAETAGISIKIPFFSNPFKGFNFLNGTTTLYDILNKNSYYQKLLIGTYKDFGAFNAYFKKHNVNKIKDFPIIFKEEKLDDKYNIHFGIDDEVIFNNAKKNLLLLAKEKQPFNFNLITSDTHFPAGYLRKNCPKRYKDQYSNVLSCSDKLIFDFISWIQKQDFYKNTTIVLVGDHLLMDTEKYYSDIPKNYKRKVYFTIINPHKNAVKMLKKQRIQNQPREFSTLDVFPTILASIGAKIDGNKLGLGVNLFSNEKTLVEKMGLKKLNVELEKRSKFYEDNFY